MGNPIKEALSKSFESKRVRLPATVTAAPMVGLRSAGYVTATVGGVAGVRVIVPTDNPTPVAVNDEILVEGVGTPAAMTYTMSAGLSGARTSSGVFVVPSPQPGGFAAGDILLGSTDDDWGNWFYEYASGRWIMRRGTTMHGAIGNLNGLYDYEDVIYGAVFGEYVEGETWIATDPEHGFRIMNWQTRAFQVEPTGRTAFGYAGFSEIVINPDLSQILFTVNNETLMTIDARGRTILGLERLGRELGPCIEWGPIPDPGGDETLERFGFWVRDQSARFFGVWSGNDVDPQDAGLRIGAQGASKYLDFSNGELDIAAQMHVLGDSEITGAMTVLGTLDVPTPGKITWGGDFGTFDSDGFRFVDTTHLKEVYVAADDLAALRVITTGTGFIFPVYAVEVTGAKNGLYVSGADYSIVVENAPIYGNDERYVAMGTASEDTDGLNRITADGRYIALPATPERGDVLFYDGAGWTRLAHGTAGQALLSGGHDADPYWG